MAPQADTERAGIAKRNEALANEVVFRQIKQTRFHDPVRQIIAEDGELPTIAASRERYSPVEKYLASSAAGLGIIIGKKAVSAEQRFASMLHLGHDGDSK